MFQRNAQQSCGRITYQMSCSGAGDEPYPEEALQHIAASAAVHTSSEPRRPVSRLINHNGNWLPDSTFQSFLKRNCIFDLDSAWLLANQCHQSCAAGFPIFICLSTPTFLFVAFVVTFCSFICCFSSFFLLFFLFFLEPQRKGLAHNRPVISVSAADTQIRHWGTPVASSSVFFLLSFVGVKYSMRPCISCWQPQLHPQPHPHPHPQSCRWCRLLSSGSFVVLRRLVQP